MDTMKKTTAHPTIILSKPNKKCNRLISSTIFLPSTVEIMISLNRNFHPSNNYKSFRLLPHVDFLGLTEMSAQRSGARMHFLQHPVFIWYWIRIFGRGYFEKSGCVNGVSLFPGNTFNSWQNNGSETMPHSWIFSPNYPGLNTRSPLSHPFRGSGCAK